MGLFLWDYFLLDPDDEIEVVDEFDDLTVTEYESLISESGVHWGKIGSPWAQALHRYILVKCWMLSVFACKYIHHCFACHYVFKVYSSMAGVWIKFHNHRLHDLHKVTYTLVLCKFMHVYLIVNFLYIIYIIYIYIVQYY